MASGAGAANPRESQTPPVPVKKKPEDFKFGKLIGEGSYSTVVLAREIGTDKDYAMKILEKRHIIKEKKTEYVKREKEVLTMLSKHNHPFFIKLYFTFQDPERLYFGLSYAKRGELLDYIEKLGSFDDNCSRFYSAELVLALQHLHSLGIIHRDLKPENILLNEDMHIQITDFGSAKILDNSSGEPSQSGRKNSFVGTAQYVTPEVLRSKPVHHSTDLWALGCIIYQFLSGLPPFRGSHEFDIFQKINKLEYDFPDGFNPVARDLVSKLIVIDPKQRLGCPELGGYESLRQHEFYQGVRWDVLPEQHPPEILPYLPANNESGDNLWSDHKPGFDDHQLTKLLGMELHDSSKVDDKPQLCSESERRERLRKQSAENEYHQFVENNLILKQGLVEKRKGLFARRRMLLLTEGPHLYYVDPSAMVLKGEIPWSKELCPEAKNFKIFFVHTPNRTYYLEDTSGYALDWVNSIKQVWDIYYESPE